MHACLEVIANDDSSNDYIGLFVCIREDFLEVHI